MTRGSTSAHRHQSRFGILLVFVALASCAKKGDLETASPPPVRVGGTLEEYEADLARNESALRAQGVALPERALAVGANVEQQSPAGGEPAKTSEGAPSATPMEPSVEAPAAVDESERDKPAREEKVNDRQKDVAPRCEMICTLAENTCELESRICELAERNTEDPRYSAACQRADEDCRLASEACVDCR